MVHSSMIAKGLKKNGMMPPLFSKPCVMDNAIYAKHFYVVPTLLHSMHTLDVQNDGSKYFSLLWCLGVDTRTIL